METKKRKREEEEKEAVRNWNFCRRNRKEFN